MSIDGRIGADVVVTIRRAIGEADGNEILMVGHLDDSAKVVDIEVPARGNEYAVIAHQGFVERGDVVIHNHPSGDLSPSAPDLAIAGRLGSQGIGFYIIDNLAERVYVVAEPVIVGELTPLDAAGLARLLEPDGALQREYPEYESRPSQIEMLRRVCDAFNESSVCIVEAGTGTGKSLAYLIPALDWVVRNDERIVITTATINLQQQLVEKDIPLVKRMLGAEPGVFLVVGRRNYVCQARLREALEEPELYQEDSDDLRAIDRWALTSETGLRSDLSFHPREETWGRVCSESDTCLGLRCERRENCFVLKARKRAADAKVLVTNHHLLFSDLALRLSGTGFEATAVLPPFRRIIFDEAHSVESSATSYFSESFNRFSVGKHLGRLYRRARGRESGLLVRLDRLAASGTRASGIGAQELAPLIEESLDSLGLLDSQGLDLVGAGGTFRITAAGSESSASVVLEAVGRLGKSLTALSDAVDRILDAFPPEHWESLLVHECRLVGRKLGDISRICRRFAGAEKEPDTVFWLDGLKTSRGERYCRFVATPLDVSQVMRSAVFEPYRTIVFTSATLTVGGSFSFWRSRVGLDSIVRRSVQEDAFESPFNFRENVLLGVPTDAPPPDDRDYQEYTYRFVEELIIRTGGSALVLFTSYSMLREAFDSVREAASRHGIRLFRQGEDDRNRLLLRFKDDTRSVLFATDSFWQGIDAPGETLRTLAICRLPFRVPSHPVWQARMEAVESRGGNAFWELAVPDAVVRMRQGFGRLIRKTSDWGAVILLDSRIVRKSYGRLFLDSLPETRSSFADGSKLLAEVEGFIAERTRRGALGEPLRDVTFLRPPECPTS